MQFESSIHLSRENWRLKEVSRNFRDDGWKSFSTASGCVPKPLEKMMEGSWKMWMSELESLPTSEFTKNIKKHHLSSLLVPQTNIGELEWLEKIVCTWYTLVFFRNTVGKQIRILAILYCLFLGTVKTWPFQRLPPNQVIKRSRLESHGSKYCNYIVYIPIKSHFWRWFSFSQGGIC